MTASTNTSARARAVAASTRRLKATIPPNPDTGSDAHARANASPAPAPTAVPQGLVCLTTTHAGSWRSATRRQALDLAGGGHGIEGRAEVAVERRALMRVLAVAKVLDLLVGEGEAVRERVLAGGDRVAAALRFDLGEVPRDGGLVARAVAEGL